MHVDTQHPAAMGPSAKRKRPSHTPHAQGSLPPQQLQEGTYRGVTRHSRTGRYEAHVCWVMCGDARWVPHHQCVCMRMHTCHHQHAHPRYGIRGSRFFLAASQHHSVQQSPLTLQASRCDQYAVRTSPHLPTFPWKTTHKSSTTATW